MTVSQKRLYNGAITKKIDRNIEIHQRHKTIDFNNLTAMGLFNTYSTKNQCSIIHLFDDCDVIFMFKM